MVFANWWNSVKKGLRLQPFLSLSFFGSKIAFLNLILVFTNVLNFSCLPRLVRRVTHGVRMVTHGVKKVTHGARKVTHGVHIILEIQSLSGWSEEVTLSYQIKLILKCVPVIP